LRAPLLSRAPLSSGAPLLSRATWQDGAMVEMSREEFEEAVSDALDRIPAHLARMMDNVVVLVEDSPPPDVGLDLLGLYEGIPLTERDWYAGVLPDRITIFRLPTLMICSSREEVLEQVVVTVVHEIAHHFGIDDERLQDLGWG
jgi:predicted Zn-dependent protease with MMP-like domain